MADGKRTEKLPQVGTCLGGESHSSTLEDLPMDSGEGNHQLFVSAQDASLELELEPGELVDTRDIFSRSSLTSRTPPKPLTDVPELCHRSDTDRDMQLDTSTVGETSSQAEPPVGSGGVPTAMTRMEYKMFVKERKIASGTWVSNKHWKKRKRESQGSSGDGSGVSPLKRPESNVSPQTSHQPPQKRHRSNNPSAGTSMAGGVSYRDQLVGVKMVVAPVTYPDRRFTAEDCDKLQDVMMELVLSDEGADLPHQFDKIYHEKGALVVTCGNSDTVSWLKRVCPKLTLEGEGGTEVIVAEYKDLLRTTKVLLRTDRRLAKADSTQVFVQIERQNPGIVTTDWRVIGGKKEQDHQIIVLAIDEMSAQVLKDRGWRIYLGLGRVQLRVISGVPSDDPGPSGEPTTQ